jgi:uncharacterized membrane protein
LADRREHLPEKGVDLDDVQHYSSNARIHGLSDGIFGVAMTLLVLEIAVPAADLSHDAIVTLLTHELPKILVYAMSFIILGTYWVGHAIQFHYIIRADRPLMVRTVVFLLFVTFVPFSTAFLGNHHEDRLAIAVYCANLALCGLANVATLAHATKDPLMLHAAMDKRIFRGITASFLAGPLMYLIAFLVSLVNVTAAFVICVAVPILTFFPNPFWGRIFARFARNRAAADEEAAAERAEAR